MKINLRLSLVISVIVSVIYLLIYIVSKNISQDMVLLNILPKLSPWKILILDFLASFIFSYCILILLDIFQKENDEPKIDDQETEDWVIFIDYKKFYITVFILMAIVTTISISYFNPGTAIIIISSGCLLASLIMYLGPFIYREHNSTEFGFEIQPKLSLLVGLINIAIIGIILGFKYSPLVWLEFSGLIIIFKSTVRSFKWAIK